MRVPLNLARHPFRNDRLPTLVLTAGLLLLAVATARHALVARDLRAGGARDIEHELLAILGETEALRAEARSLGRQSAAPEQIEEWTALRKLVDQRAFSWTGLFAALEKALPPGVRLVSVSPSHTDGTTEVRLTAVGRGVDDAIALPKALEAQGEFEAAFLDGYGETNEGVTITCSVRYVGAPTPDATRVEASVPSAAPAPPGGGAR